MEVMTIGREPKTPTASMEIPHGWQRMQQKMGFDCNVGKSARMMRHKLKTIETPICLTYSKKNICMKK